MRRSLFGTLALACGLAFAACLVAPANALQINTSIVECHAELLGSPDQIFHAVNGVGTLNTTTTAQGVVCSVPVSASLGLGANLRVYVDGDNMNGASTSCTLTVYPENGDTHVSVGFQTSFAHYDWPLDLDASVVTATSHFVLECVLPAHGNGVLRGVTSLPFTPAALG